MRIPGLRLLVLLVYSPGLTAAAEFPRAFFAKYCFDCHNDQTQEAEIRLDTASDRDWSARESLKFFERVKNVVESGEMPPKDEEHRPTKAERAETVQWLHNKLLEHSRVGGTVLRRLNRVEYENTVRAVFGLNDFQVPEGFPPDQTHHGFDNVGEALVLSGPLLEAYHEAAISVADRFFPPPRPPVAPRKVTVTPDDMVISYSSGQIVGGAMRLASKSEPVMRSCSWPTKFEARGSGNYRVKLKLSAIGVSNDAPAKFQLLAKKVSDSDSIGVSKLRKLAEFDVVSDTTTEFTDDVEIYRGETVVFYWANAPLDSDTGDRAQLRQYLSDRFNDDPRLMAAWMALKHNSGIRGGVGWERVKKILADPKLDTSKAKVDSTEGEKLLKTMTGNMVMYVETLSYDLFENGPNLGVHELKLEGPFGEVEDDVDRESRRLQKKLFAGKTKVDDVLQRVLTSAFRRPVRQSQVAEYSRLVEAEGYHLAFRTALMSPDFLYRETRPGTLDDYDLASRLAYCLTSAPPDSTLLDKARAGKLTDPKVLASQATRLLKARQPAFVRHFSAQWLGTQHLDDIMPDPRLLKFNDNDLKAIAGEPSAFVGEILAKNLPLKTFIDPDFAFMRRESAAKIYGRRDVKAKNMTRVSLKPDSPHGGLLGMASVMMATANGVDTQPVVRGVWVLENVLGDPPPPPPTNVPALTPDTRGAKTVRDLLQAHRNADACARCHRKIDPLGYVLENFDPVGRWRTHYPVYNSDGKATDGAKIDASGLLGHAQFEHVNDLKAYVLQHLDRFAACLGKKILTYATGRELSYADRQEVEQIAQRNVETEAGFRDFLIDLITSDAFRTK